MGFELSPEYKDVPARIADFKAKHPEGCLRPANPDEPYKIEALGGEFFIVYTAAAHRSPDDPCPGIGVAWEPFPGKTPYTKNSELQNAETSAWGRAIVAVLASESKHVASAEDVRNRQADAEAQPVERFVTPEGELVEVWPGELSARAAKDELVAALGGDRDAAAQAWKAAGFADRVKLRRDEVDPLLALMRGGTKVGAGATSKSEGPQDAEANPAGSGPAASPGVQPGVKAAEAPAPNALPLSDPDQPIDARAIGIRAPKVFDKVVERYPERKKSWVQEHLRHAMAYIASDGKATSSTQLTGEQLLKVWGLLDAIEAGTLTFTFSADPANGCEFLWDDGATRTVMWSELHLAEAGAA